MPKFLVTVQGFRQYVVEAESREEAETEALEDADDCHWNAEEATAVHEPLSQHEIERAIALGAEEL